MRSMTHALAFMFFVAETLLFFHPAGGSAQDRGWPTVMIHVENGRISHSKNVTEPTLLAAEHSAIQDGSEGLWGSMGLSVDVRQDSLLPDLTVSNVMIIDGQGMDISYAVQIQNQGDGQSTACGLDIYIGSSPSLDASSIKIDETTIPGIGPNMAFMSGMMHATVSGPPGTNYYLIADVDPSNSVEETNENNNTGSAGYVTMPYPDLVVTDVNITDPFGPDIAYSFSIMNQSEAETDACEATIFLSEDGNYTGSEPEIGQWSVPSLLVWGTYTSGTVQTTVSGVPDGRYFLLVFIDGDDVVEESDEENNLGSDEDARVMLPGNIDFGDAPDTYKTRYAGGGAWHPVSDRYFLGEGVDGEPDGQPDGDAMGDDNAGADDEDGVILHDFIAGQVGMFPINTNFPAALNAWVDFNQDGDWNDPGERIISCYTCPPGVHSYHMPVPPDAVLGTTYARFRYSLDRDDDFQPYGEGLEGEVEDHVVHIIDGDSLDFGDAPEGPGYNYRTSMASNGAYHRIHHGIVLGHSTGVDGEPDGHPAEDGLGDDNSDADDEDGVFLPSLVPGETATLSVDTKGERGGRLHGWIDFNRDGDWDDPGEKVIGSVSIEPGTQTTHFQLEVPSYAVPGYTYARFRYAWEWELSYFGRSLAGEVEDYRVRILYPGQFETYILTIDNAGEGNGFVHINGQKVWQFPFDISFTEGTEVTLNATGEVDSRFQEWGGDVTGSDNPVQLIMDSDKQVTAHFTHMIGPATLLSPVNDAENILITPNLHWEAVMNADHYTVRYGTEDIAWEDWTEITDIVHTFQQIGPLAYNTVYWWTVQPVRGNYFSYSDAWRFTTGTTSRFWADIDGDGDVDIIDVQLVAARWNTQQGDPGYEPRFDLDNEGQGDGDIDIIDVQLVAAWWNKPIPPE